MNTDAVKLIEEAMVVVQAIIETVRKLAAGDVTPEVAREHLAQLRSGLAANDATIDAQLGGATTRKMTAAPENVHTGDITDEDDGGEVIK